MPFQVGSLSDIPRATRHKISPVEQSDEWMKAKTKLAAGLGPNEAFWITFTIRDKKNLQLKCPSRTFKDRLKRYLRQMNLKYEIVRYKNGDNEIIAVSNRVVSHEGAITTPNPRKTSD